jgi:hypothetical protein
MESNTTTRLVVVTDDQGVQLQPDQLAARLGVKLQYTTNDGDRQNHDGNTPLPIPPNSRCVITGDEIDINGYEPTEGGFVPPGSAGLFLQQSKDPSPLFIKDNFRSAATLRAQYTQVTEAVVHGFMGEYMQNARGEKATILVRATGREGSGPPESRADQGEALGTLPVPRIGAIQGAPVARPMITRPVQRPAIAARPGAPVAGKGRTVTSNLLRAVIESTDVQKKPAPVPVTPRVIQLSTEESLNNNEVLRRWEVIRGRALGHEADLYGTGEPPPTAWQYISEAAARILGKDVDIEPLLVAAGPYDPLETPLLTSTGLEDDSAIAQEIETQLARPTQKRSFRPLMIYAQECVALLDDRNYAYEFNDNPALGDDDSAVAAISLPYGGDGCSSGRAALLLSCLCFRDRTLYHAAIDLTRDVPMTSAPGEPLGFLSYTHKIGMVALSDACYDRVQSMERALSAQNEKIVTPDGMRCMAVSPWTALALARACASASIEVRLACMRSKYNRHDIPSADETDDGVVDHHHATLDNIDNRFGTILLDTYKNLVAEGYSTQSLMSIAAGVMHIVSATETLFVELPPATTPELRMALHVQGALNLATELGESTFLGAMALEDARRPWTHVRPEGEEWPGFCINNLPKINVMLSGKDTNRARMRVATTGQAAQAAVQAAVGRLAPGRRASDTRALVRSVDSAVATHMAAVLSMTSVLARSSPIDRQYVARLVQDQKRQSDMNSGVLTNDLAYDMLFEDIPETKESARFEEMPLGSLMSGLRTRPRTLFN